MANTLERLPQRRASQQCNSHELYSGRKRFGSIRFGSGLLGESSDRFGSVRFGSVRTINCPSSKRFGLRFSDG